MKRDHLMGYAPAADFSANGLDELAYLYEETYPLGIPKRVYGEWEEEDKVLQIRQRKAYVDFENLIHPDPDGMFHDKTGARIGLPAGVARSMPAKRVRMGYTSEEIKPDGPVVQPTVWSYSESASLSAEAWKKLHHDLMTKGTGPIGLRGGLDELVRPLILASAPYPAMAELQCHCKACQHAREIAGPNG